MNTTAFNNTLNTLTLRCDNNNDASIQAWNQADRYLLNMLEQHLIQHPEHSNKVAIINDDWGALTITTASLSPQIYSDSAIFSHWLTINSNPLNMQHTVQSIDTISDTSAKVILVKLPKTIGFYEHILQLLSQLNDVTVYVAGMQKYWPASFFKVGEKYFNDAASFDGIKKAKCVRLTSGKNVPSTSITTQFDVEEFALHSINYPNVFSAKSLDMGTRFFIENFPKLDNIQTCTDLACGNGLLGIFALKQFPQLHCNFIDESFYAIKSTLSSLDANHINENRYKTYHNDALHTLDINKVDAILCNPPFHQLHRIGNHITNTMIQQSALHLTDSGSLYLIGNSHLGYYQLLKNHFSQVDTINKNTKFILFKASNAIKKDAI